MKYREAMEIFRKYPSCCTGKCSDGKCKIKSSLPKVAEKEKYEEPAK